METHKKHRLAKEGALGNVAEQQKQKFNKWETKNANIDARAVQQTQLKPKSNKKNNFDYKFIRPIYLEKTWSFRKKKIKTVIFP